jgi:hypothetical protein
MYFPERLSQRPLFMMSEEEDDDEASNSGGKHVILTLIEEETFDKGKNYNEEDIEFTKLIPLRASTAPPRPLTELEEFRRSSDFLLLENTVMLSNQLKQRPDNKYDLDSPEGQRSCKRFLNQIERLCEVIKLF